jgi:hypothetical protein
MASLLLLTNYSKFSWLPIHGKWNEPLTWPCEISKNFGQTWRSLEHEYHMTTFPQAGLKPRPSRAGTTLQSNELSICPVCPVVLSPKMYLPIWGLLPFTDVWWCPRLLDRSWWDKSCSVGSLAPPICGGHALIYMVMCWSILHLIPLFH